MNKKSLFKVIFSLLITGVMVFATISCEVGMGESIDLEPPFLQIDDGIHGSYKPKSLTLTGDAYDDRHLDSVVVNYSYRKGGQTITGSKKAKVSGKRWSCDFTFDSDYEVEFEAYAYDMLKNGSDTSHDRAMVLIDSIDPDVNKMSIVRGNYVARLVEQSQFTGTNGKATADQINEPQNKDYFQNESFKINSNLKDNYGIGSALLDLYEGNTLIKSNIKPIPSENKFAPEFEITEEMLGGPGSNKIRYIRPVLKVKDEAGNPKERGNDGVFAWYPEYNKPHVKYTTKIGDLITVPQGNTIPISVFDDDDLKTVKYGLFKQEGFTTKELVESSLTTAYTNTTNEKIRDKNFDVATTDSSNNNLPDGMYWLVVKVEDLSAHSARDYYFEKTAVKITNADAPVIDVTSPTENSSPQLINDKFKITGYVADNQHVKKMAIAWLPNGSSDTGIAQSYFTDTAKGYQFTKDETYNGIKIYKLNSLTPNSPFDTTLNKFKDEFEKEFNFYNDFKVNNKVTNDSKVFMIAARDEIDNVTVRIFRMNKITSKPSFEVEWSQDGGTTWTKEAKPLINFENVVSTKFKITPKVDAGAPVLSSCTVTAASTGQGHSNLKQSDATTKAWTFDIDNPAGGAILNFTLNAKDKIGSEAAQNLTIMFSELGVLLDISCNAKGGKTFTAGQTIKMQATFSSKVTLSNVGTTDAAKPYIQLSTTGTESLAFRKHNGNDNYTAIAETSRRAVYKSGSNSNTLVFEYTVPKNEEIEAKKIAIDTINLNGATIIGKIGDKRTATNDPTGKNGTWIDNVTTSFYNVDTVKPYIKSITPGNNGVVTKKADGTVDIKITFNEPVNVESGTIIMQRTPDWYIPPVLSEKVFQKIWQACETDDRRTLCSSPDKTFEYGTDPDACNHKGEAESGEDAKKTLIAKGPYMMYTNGLKEETIKNSKGDDVVVRRPDRTTKYVLAYEYDIGSKTDTVVNNLRAVLENHNYHKAEWEITSLKGKGTTTLTLNVKDSNFADRIVNGVEYFLSITPEAICDENGNYYRSGEESSEANNKVKVLGNAYTFWVGPVATPVIRVNRIATNGGGDKNSPATKGVTNVKIDCETPGATISYGIATYTKKGLLSDSDNNSVLTSIGEIAATSENITKNIGNVTYTALADKVGGTLPTVPTDTTATAFTMTANSGTEQIPETIGDGAKDTCQKIYIGARATKSGVTGLTESDVGYEGGFKTVLYYKYTTTSGHATRIYGAQSPEGTSFTAGFPLTQNSSARSKYQCPWQDGSLREYYWVSWQIISDFTLQVYGGSNGGNNFQDPANPGTSYGMYIFCKNKDHYGA